MDVENIELKQGMNIKVYWVDGDETEGRFIMKERGYIVMESSGSVQACLPAHLTKLEVLENAET